VMAATISLPSESGFHRDIPRRSYWMTPGAMSLCYGDVT
jgi:hypothetical protein